MLRSGSGLGLSASLVIGRRIVRVVHKVVLLLHVASVCVCVCVYIYKERERERERGAR